MNYLTVCHSKIHELVEEQQQEMEKAVIGSKWFTMSKEQRKRSLQKFNSASLTSSFKDESLHLCTSPSPSPSHPSGSMFNPLLTTSQSQLTVLSVLYSKLGLPPAAIEGIAKKAVDILQTEGAIVSAPVWYL